MAIAGIVASFSLPFLYVPFLVLFATLSMVAIGEALMLSRASHHVTAHREAQDKLSLGDPQTINYRVENGSRFQMNIEVVDELPYQFQLRDSIVSLTIYSHEHCNHKEVLTPLQRGEYQFGKLHLYISLPFPGFIQYRKSNDLERKTQVYPSFIQMRKHAMEVFSQTATLSGIRRIRAIGETDEFEQIRPYQQGDHIKSINWKATSRKNQLMVNQFQNTRSQQIYCIIDKGRAMKMPFAGLTLLDYAINSTLTLSNIVLRKFDKAGLITFSDKMGQIVKAENHGRQLNLLAEQLYAQKTGYKEADFGILFQNIRQQIKRRSVMLFFTNFEHLYDLDRHIHFLRAINGRHLLIVIFFVNTELSQASRSEAKSIEDIYIKTEADKAIMAKELIRNRLQLHGIQTILTSPADLSIQVINKYLEIKAKRMQ